MDKENYLDKPQQWKEGRALTITFIVTEDCQLRCKYCYIQKKGNNNKMSLYIAKTSIDYILKNNVLFPEQSVIIEFVGGEPLLEIELIEQISDYFKTQMFLLDHPWFNSYRINISTNGLLYNDKNVQRYIMKNKYHINLTISLDGNKEKHDLQRVFPDGEGSYLKIIGNFILFLNQFTDGRTKVTVSKLDIPHVADSVLHLFSLGVKFVDINCVFEDVWEIKDDLLFEEQLIKLADEIIDKKMYINYSCSFFDKTIGKPMDSFYDNENWCGAGKMLAIDPRGGFYPCLRFIQYSLKNRKEKLIGDAINGINTNKLRPFKLLSRTAQSDHECVTCSVARGCAWCQAENYDCAKSNTIFERSKSICKMHKARVRANNYYWSKIGEPV